VIKCTKQIKYKTTAETTLSTLKKKFGNEDSTGFIYIMWLGQ